MESQLPLVICDQNSCPPDGFQSLRDRAIRVYKWTSGVKGGPLGHSPHYTRAAHHRQLSISHVHVRLF